MQLFAQQLRENSYPDLPSDEVVEVAQLAVEPSRLLDSRFDDARREDGCTANEGA